ncbi:PLP-dependent aminotransferase family protein [Pseudovibrio sp. SPO723]|uniref:aminotransferase-like domain-containing protein n=1 Tax=Nesiotobacter zosterae TaxID=392721 RepID=UPI0029C1D22D|nr:PLP-dependent aminotransferase family protein [Pseudovibrio sp. SPO723]MDX5595733.1 PLP-dependent aminotransferase family protein [Pseudovibrio sp. SPO723]
MTMWVPDIEGAEGPKYLAIAEMLARDVADGRLQPGEKLPPQRELAYQLGVTLGTISRAYAEAERRKLVKGETGRGTFVCANEDAPPSPLTPPVDGSSNLDLARNFAFAALNPDLGAAMMAVARLPDLASLNAYVPSEGLEHHRRAGAEFFNAHYGGDVTAQQTLVTCGAQHGIKVLINGLFERGDVIGVDELCYPSLLDSAVHDGYRLMPISNLRKSDGSLGAMDPEAIGDAAKRHGLRGLFIMPSVQNPTTHTMTLAERAAIAEACGAHGVKIIEDDPYTPFLSEKAAPFSKLLPELTASISSMSKVMAPGLRVGFVHLPMMRTAGIRNFIGESVWMASPVAAEIACYWARSGAIADTLSAKRTALAQRYSMLQRVLAGFSVKGGAEKPFAWVSMPEGVSSVMVQEHLRGRGVDILASHYFQLPERHRHEGLRLSLGNIARDEDFERALMILGEALETFGSGSRGRELMG